MVDTSIGLARSADPIGSSLMMLILSILNKTKLKLFMLLRSRRRNRITIGGEARLRLLTDPILDSTTIEINLTLNEIYFIYLFFILFN